MANITSKVIIETVTFYHDKIRMEFNECEEYINGDTLKDPSYRNRLNLILKKNKSIFDGIDHYVLHTDLKIKKVELISKFMKAYTKLISELRWYKCEHFTKMMDETFVKHLKNVLINVQYANDAICHFGKNCNINDDKDIDKENEDGKETNASDDI